MRLLATPNLIRMNGTWAHTHRLPVLPARELAFAGDPM
jgi:hypothetical protein